MTAPQPPTLEQLAALTGQMAPVLRWLEELHRQCSTQLALSVAATTGLPAMSDQQARTAMWEVLGVLGAYIRTMPPPPPAS